MNSNGQHISLRNFITIILFVIGVGGAGFGILINKISAIEEGMSSRGERLATVEADYKNIKEIVGDIKWQMKTIGEKLDKVIGIQQTIKR